MCRVCRVTRRFDETCFVHPFSKPREVTVSDLKGSVPGVTRADRTGIAERSGPDPPLLEDSRPSPTSSSSERTDERDWTETCGAGDERDCVGHPESTCCAKPTALGEQGD